MRSIQRVCHGMCSTFCLMGTFPHLRWLFLRDLQTMQALQVRLTWDRGPMNVQCEHSVNSGRFDPGCSKCTWHHLTALHRMDSGRTILLSQVIGSCNLFQHQNICCFALVGLLWDPCAVPWIPCVRVVRDSPLTGLSNGQTTHSCHQSLMAKVAHGKTVGMSSRCVPDQPLIY